MNIAYRLWQAGNKIIPGNQGGIMTGNQHIIDTGPGQWRQIMPGHREAAAAPGSGSRHFRFFLLL
jgi:hypothetical protein